MLNPEKRTLRSPERAEELPRLGGVQDSQESCLIENRLSDGPGLTSSVFVSKERFLDNNPIERWKSIEGRGNPDRRRLVGVFRESVGAGKTQMSKRAGG